MRLSTSLILPVLAGAASAASDATVYLFQGQQRPNTSKPPTLSPEQARLVFAQRLGVSRYHDLNGASENTLSYINQFGGPSEPLFPDLAESKPAELVMIVDGATEQTLNTWSSYQPAFTISKSPSTSSNKKLAKDLDQQVSKGSTSCTLLNAINPLADECWKSRQKIIHFEMGKKDVPSDASSMALIQELLIGFSKSEDMNAMVVFVPESSTSKSSSNVYGSYEMPSQVPLDRRQFEEAMTDVDSPLSTSSNIIASNRTLEPIRGVVPRCFTSIDACMAGTNNCSSHGTCQKPDATRGCFSCACLTTTETFSRAGAPYNVTTTWGGAACQKIDISSPFWLISIFSAVMVGLISWAIGMMYSIGEEKLPGVIGAGVSSKAR